MIHKHLILITECRSQVTHRISSSSHRSKTVSMASHFISLCRIACMLHHSTWHLMSDIICSRRSHVTKSQEFTTQEQGASTAAHLVLLTECRILSLSHLSPVIFVANALHVISSYVAAERMSPPHVVVEDSTPGLSHLILPPGAR